MATAADSEGDSADLGAALVEDSAGVTLVEVVEAVAAEVGLLVGSFRG